jgi:hypothetical protein
MFLEQAIEGLGAYHISIWNAATYWLNVTSHNTQGQAPAGNPRSLNKQDANGSSTTQQVGPACPCAVQSRMTGSGKTFHAYILHSHSQSLFRILLKYVYAAGRAESVKRQDRGFDSRLCSYTYRKSS